MLTQEQKVIKIIAKTLPAVVSIEAYKSVQDVSKKRPGWLFPLFESETTSVESLRKKIRGKHIHFGGGSGFIADAAGIIITNVHVIVREHLDYEITSSDSKKYQAKLVATDPLHDIAYLRISADTNFPCLPLGDSSKVQLGQSVLAVGNALGLFRNTVSSGIISGLARSIEANNETLSENLHGLIQTDAAINPGNSGGPLINMEGKVIGINAASVMQAENIGFAIPINTIKHDLEQVKKYGKITRPFLGVRYIIIDNQIKDVLKLPVSHGVIAISPNPEHSAIIKNSPADKAGIKERDIILEINGAKLTPSYSIQEFLDASKIGQRLSIKILRNHRELNLSAVLVERK
jgi:serine protease Do